MGWAGVVLLSFLFTRPNGDAQGNELSYSQSFITFEADPVPAAAGGGSQQAAGVTPSYMSMLHSQEEYSSAGRIYLSMFLFDFLSI